MGIVDNGLVRKLLVGACVGCGSSTPPGASISPAMTGTSHTEASAVGSPGSGSSAPLVASSAVDPPDEPEPVRYDLRADIEDRGSEARDELGTRTAVDVVEDVFVVVSPKGSGALSGAVEVTRLALRAYFNGRFSHRPDRAISVYLFPDAGSYEAYCHRRWRTQCLSPYGFYMHDERRIVMNVGPGIGTLTHELVHPLVAVDFPQAPDWINEGIASLFEQPQLGKPGEIHGGKNWRHPRLMAAFGSKTEREGATLPALFSMTDRVFRGPKEDLNYAMARYFCQWLDQKNLLWAFYHRWRDTFAQDHTGERAFAEVVGKTPEQASADWSQWVHRI